MWMEPRLAETTDQAGPMTSLANLAVGQALESYEALALTQLVCEAVIESPECRGASTITRKDLFITAAGDVVMTAGPQPPGAAVPRIARLFSDLLPEFHRRA